MPEGTITDFYLSHDLLAIQEVRVDERSDFDIVTVIQMCFVADTANDRSHLTGREQFRSRNVVWDRCHRSSR